MTQAPRRPDPAGYRLRVAGHLDHHWAPWFAGLTLTHEADGTTTLTGVVSDQAELHGALTKIRDLGVTLISVAAVDLPDGVDRVQSSSASSAAARAAPSDSTGR